MRSSALSLMQPVFMFPFFFLVNCMYILIKIFRVKKKKKSANKQCGLIMIFSFQSPEQWFSLPREDTKADRPSGFSASLWFFSFIFCSFCCNTYRCIYFSVLKKTTLFAFWANQCWESVQPTPRPWTGEAVRKQKKDGWIVSLLFLYHFQLNSGFIEFADDCILLWSTFYTEHQPFWKLGWCWKNTVKNK